MTDVRGSRARPAHGQVVSQGEMVRVPGTLVWFQIGALGFSLNHILLDFQLGLFGRSEVLSTPAGVLLVLVALIYALWAFALARAVQGWADTLPSLVVYAVVWALIGNGGAVAFCLPPCAGSVPFGEIAHAGSLVLGGLGAYSAWRAMRQAPVKASWWRGAIDLSVIVVTFYVLSQVATV